MKHRNACIPARFEIETGSVYVRTVGILIMALVGQVCIVNKEVWTQSLPACMVPTQQAAPPSPANIGTVDMHGLHKGCYQPYHGQISMFHRSDQSGHSLEIILSMYFQRTHCRLEEDGEKQIPHCHQNTSTMLI